MTKSERNRRYRLHQKIKKLYKYSPGQKTIYVAYSEELQNPDVAELCNNYNYPVQYIIT